jgi:hypothetical protein
MIMSKELTGRERVIKALNFDSVDRVPIEVNEAMVPGFSSDVLRPAFTYGRGKSSGTTGVRGTYTDYWGSLWEAAEDGVKGEVKHPLLEDWEDIKKLEIPWDVLEQADLSGVQEQGETTGRFVMKMFGIEPFQRMQYLRGTEDLFMDIALEDDHILKLRDMVHDFYKAEVTLWAKSAADGIHLEDDWGSQNRMLINPKVWRELFKPLYKDYCDIAKKHNKKVVMHSDGYILDIIPDLIEIGVDAINPQIDVMPLDSLSEVMKGKTALWGGIDRQRLLPFGTKDEIRASVKTIGEKFFVNGISGVIGQAFFDKGAKIKNLQAVYSEWSLFSGR